LICQICYSADFADQIVSCSYFSITIVWQHKRFGKRQFMKVLKKIILWEYKRGTWQYDVLCFLIIAFIFLTPKSWFEKEPKTLPVTTRLLIKSEDFMQTKEQIQQIVREISGNPNAQVISWKERRNEKGEVFYEIEIR